MKRVNNLGLILAATLILSSQVMPAATATTVISYKNATVENDKLSANRTKAKLIFNALEQYYAENGVYPSENDFISVMKTKLGNIPKYKDNTLMIRSYKAVKKDKNGVLEYKIQFNDDKSTTYDESKGTNNIMSSYTIPSDLFNPDFNENDILSASRAKAKEIQNALDQCYADTDSYPDEKDFNNVIKDKLGAIPSYRDNMPMIKKYIAIKFNKDQIIEYKIYFNDDKSTAYDESNGENSIMNQFTNTKDLFNQNAVENSKLATNRVKAKEIQYILQEYYVNTDSYPDEKDFSDVIIDKLGAMPSYGDNTPMINKYSTIENSQNQIIAYVIQFNDDKSTVNDESKGNCSIMDEATNINNLFDQNAFENYNLTINRINAREIQYALAQYYTDNHSYPAEKDFENVMKSKVGEIVRYKDNTPMVKKYTVIKKNKNQVIGYNIQFNDDKNTTYDESKGGYNIMSQETDTNNLFIK